MTDITVTVRTLAAVAAVKKLLADVEQSAKRDLAATLTRGTVYAHTGAGVELGYATVPKPARPKPRIDIVDEAQLLAWMVGEFGEDVVETRVQLTEQGRASLDAYVDALVASGSDSAGAIPGVEITTPPPRPAAPRFTPAKDIVELVRGMAAAGELDLSEVLALGAGVGDE